MDGKLKTEIINEQEFCVQQKRNSTICNGRDNVCVCFDHGGYILLSNYFTYTLPSMTMKIVN